MKSKTIFKVLGVLALVLMVASFIPAAADVLDQFHIISKGGGAMAIAPLVTAFTKDIEEKLYPPNEFYHHAVDDSVWIQGHKVSRGVAGASPGRNINPVLPLTGTQRADDTNEYEIELHVTDPTILTRDEELLVNYNKRISIVNDHINVLNTGVADNFAYQWAPTAAGVFIRTTGANVNVSDGSQTGTRKAIEKDNFIDALTILTKQNAKGQKYALVPATLYGQLLKVPDFVDYTKTGRPDILKTGIVGEILGIKIYVRSYTTLYTSAGTPVKKAIDAVGAATDNLSILIWDETMVYKALGKPNTNIENRPVTYLGDLINADVRAGGKARKDGSGVVSIIQAVGA